MIVPRQAMLRPEDVDPTEDQTVNLTVFAIFLVVITAVCIVMRITSRKIQKLDLWLDDWTFLVGSLLAEGLFITSIIYSTRAGLGAHWPLLTFEQQSLFQRLNYAYNILNLSCYPLIKISILFLYLRIFVSSRIRFWAWAGIVFLACMVTANVLTTIFACRPIQKFWDLSITGGTCIDLTSFSWATAVLNVVTDVYILVLPMPTVWRLQTTTRRKLAITGIFVMGTLTFIVSIIRIVYYQDFRANDPSWTFLGTAYATPAEDCLGVIVASAPTWRPVWARLSDMASQVFTSLRSRRSSKGSGDSSGSSQGESGSDMETFRIHSQDAEKNTVNESDMSAKIPASSHSYDNRSETTATNAV